MYPGLSLRGDTAFVGFSLCGFVVDLVMNRATITAMMEKASPAIIKTIMEDAPIRDQLLNEGFLMVQVTEKMVSTGFYASMVFIILPDDICHGFYTG